MGRQGPFSWLVVALAVAGCGNNSGTTVLVSVDSAIQLSNVGRLSAHASAGAKSKDFDVPLKTNTIPPTHSFAIEVPPSITGEFDVEVRAFHTNGAELARASKGTLLSPGSTVELDIQFGQLEDAGVSDGGGDGESTNDAAADLALPSDLVNEPATPRLLAPLSTSAVTQQEPTLRWQLGPGSGTATVELCKDHSCSALLTGVTAMVANDQLSAKPSAVLPPGWVYWRVRVDSGTQTAYSATWQFWGGQVQR
jgi:hypothetical protein